MKAPSDGVEKVENRKYEPSVCEVEEDAERGVIARGRVGRLDHEMYSDPEL